MIVSLFSIEMLFTYKPVRSFNPDERLWVEVADKVWAGKGSLNSQPRNYKLPVPLYKLEFLEVL